MDDTILTALRLTSYIVTGLVGLGFIRRRMLLDGYVEGLWEGHISDPDDRQFYLHCTVILTKRRGTPCAGFLRYTTHKGEKLLASGVDRLADYEGRQFLPRAMTATFVREFHHDMVDGSRDVDDAVYLFLFKIPIVNLVWTSELVVETKLKSGRIVRGRLHRFST